MLSFVIPVIQTDTAFWARMARLAHHITNVGIVNFEIIVVPNGQVEESEYLGAPPISERIRQLPRIMLPGKGRALQAGFLAARGDKIFMIDADLPFDLSFVEKAYQLIDSGKDLVYANRRHAESYFRVKVPTLHLAFRRHWFGLIFNRMARFFLGLRSKDTQAGMKALSRRLAKEVSTLARCPGFLFDLEIFLIAQERGWAITDLPVVFNLECEKSSVRLFKETAAILTWLPKIRWNLFTGRYAPGLVGSLKSLPA